MLTVVVMAAGLGTRFKDGVKQLAKVGPNGETMMELSIMNAIKNGFNHVVFIIRKDIEDQLKEQLEGKFEGIKIDFVYQEMPEEFNERTKPLGTGYAVLCAKEKVNNPFVVINADDYYGKESFKQLEKFFKESKDENEYSLVAYKLDSTLSDIGSVSRGICKVENDYLVDIEENFHIQKIDGIIKSDTRELTGLEDTSMNIWGFKQNLFDILEEEYLNKKSSLGEKEEFLLPDVIKTKLKSNIKVKVLRTTDKYYGITYKEDLEELKNHLELD